MNRLIIIIWVLVILSSITIAQTGSVVNCGDIIESNFAENAEMHVYNLQLEAGATFTVVGDPLGDTLKFSMVMYAPNENWIDSTGGSYYTTNYADPSITSGVVSANGNYVIRVSNNSFERGNPGRIYDTNGGVGIYTLYISCQLRNGTVINAGDSPPNIEDGQEDNVESAPPPTAQPAFAFGFPGVAPVNFEGGIEIPIQVGQPFTVPVGDNVGLYTFEIQESRDVTMNIARVSGDISLGVVVINRANNDIIFLSGLPSSNNLSVELSLTASGQYVIGLFRLETATRVGTTGGVQFSLE